MLAVLRRLFNLWLSRNDISRSASRQIQLSKHAHITIAIVRMFFLFIIIIVAIAVLAGRLSQARNLNVVFSRMANMYDGSILTGSMFRRPYVNLWYEDVAIQVNCFSHGTLPLFRREYIQVEIPWPDSDIWALISPLSAFSFLRRLLTHRVRTGNGSFDRIYQIQSSQPETTRELVSAGVQAQIDALRHACMSHDLSVEWADGRIYIRKRGLITDFSLLNRYVSMCVELYHQLELAQSAGIEIIDERHGVQRDSSDADEEIPVCMICGDDIEFGVVYCRTCETPHHLDCWKYNGSCSTYGCGDSHFISQRRMRRLQRREETKRLFDTT